MGLYTNSTRLTPAGPWPYDWTMEEPTDFTPPHEETQPPKPRRFCRVWVGVFAVIALGLTGRFAIEYRQTSLGRGEEIAREVTTLQEQAVKARDKADVAAARQSLAKAVELLREGEQFRRHPVYVSTLVDLGALLLSSRTPNAGDLAEGRQMLLEAWDVAKGLDARTRWRIARDLGLAAVLAGDMAEAEKWYSTATELVPEDATAKERLTTIKNAQNWK